MPDIIPRIGADSKIELVDERNIKIEGLSALSVWEAAFLGRALLACSATFVKLHPPVGDLVADAHLPIGRWIVKLADDDNVRHRARSDQRRRSQPSHHVSEPERKQQLSQ